MKRTIAQHIVNIVTVIVMVAFVLGGCAFVSYVLQMD